MIITISSYNCNSRSLIPEDSEGRPRTQKSQSERRKVKVNHLNKQKKSDKNCEDGIVPQSQSERRKVNLTKKNSDADVGESCKNGSVLDKLVCPAKPNPGNDIAQWPGALNH